MTPTWTLFAGVLVAAALAACPSHAHVHDASSLSAATALAATPRSDPKKCLADLWWGIKDSYENIVDQTKFCIGEKLDDWKFLLEDIKQFAGVVGKQLKEAGRKCLQKPASCLSELAQVAKNQLRPLADLAWRTFKALVTLGFTAAFELFGCIFLPGVLVAVWQTLMDVLIFGECLITRD